jgi:hypothetical protein
MALEAGGLEQNSTVRDSCWPVIAVKVLLAGYTAGRPESITFLVFLAQNGLQSQIKNTDICFK